MAEKRNLPEGLRKALSKNGVRALCCECTFPVPKYAGRYPQNCPLCGNTLTTVFDPDSGEEIERGHPASSDTGT